MGRKERLKMDNLPELRDIHIPEGVSAFPPAYGWWVLLLSILAVYLLVRLFALLRRKSKKRYALRLLKDILSDSPVAAAAQMSEVLRRICVYKYPEAAASSGKAWLDFLNLHSKKKLGGKAAELLLNAPYIPQTTQTYGKPEADELKAFCQTWIGENL